MYLNPIFEILSIFPFSNPFNRLNKQPAENVRITIKVTLEICSTRTTEKVGKSSSSLCHVCRLSVERVTDEKFRMNLFRSLLSRRCFSIIFPVTIIPDYYIVLEQLILDLTNPNINLEKFFSSTINSK